MGAGHSAYPGDGAGQVFSHRADQQNIRESNVDVFPTFANKAMEIKDASFATAMFARLEKADNPNIYLAAAKALIAFSDKDINRQIVEVSKRNPNLRKDWGGQEFVQMLKENRIE
ncbi:hypothetical protein ACFOTA_17245 [Chitinophaga sp. GCM10012297]|uniref:HEAT repeat domain-containing protein n=1 Tax=Chitinophaga chungangae TaxID=2821488 RepID=A0ABS3YH21_9BACT|nr:hypothetical protein [Chitinophaga chungangae]MBO9153967.1 hypothetical protein [Chitinophaga chungangae]